MTAPTNIHPIVLFIDFDGVLHDDKAGDLALHEGTMRIVGERLFCWAPLLASALSAFPDVRIAIHSSWRHFHTLDELRSLLPDLADRVVGATHGPLSRYEGILAFIHEHGVDRHFILDDMPKQFPSPCPDLFVCDPQMGINTPGALEALQDWAASSVTP